MISTSFANNGDNEALLKTPKIRWWISDRPLVALISLLLAFICGAIIGFTYNFDVYRYRCQTVKESQLGTFEQGFLTEQIFPSNAFDIHLKRFDGHVEFLNNGTEVLYLDPENPVYVGTPSPAIDRNWEMLTEGRYWSISEDEAKSLWGAGRAQYRDHVQGGYTGGFDVFHTLHCLDMLRRRLSPEYYSELDQWSTDHDASCIEQIRQSLQCTATGTITPARYLQAIGQMYVDSAQVHTCRNFENLLEYTRSRYNGSLSVPRNQWNLR